MQGTVLRSKTALNEDADHVPSKVARSTSPQNPYPYGGRGMPTGLRGASRGNLASGTCDPSLNTWNGGMRGDSPDALLCLLLGRLKSK